MLNYFSFFSFDKHDFSVLVLDDKTYFFRALSSSPFERTKIYYFIVAFESIDSGTHYVRSFTCKIC